MSRYEFIDHIFGTDDDEETDTDDLFEDDDEASDDETSDDDPEDEDEDEDELPVEDVAEIARIDKAFRSLRARVRSLTDLSELRSIRNDNAEALAGRLTPIARLRIEDIVEAIDVRVTDLRARRGRSE